MPSGAVGSGSSIAQGLVEGQAGLGRRCGQNLYGVEKVVKATVEKHTRLQSLIQERNAICRFPNL